MMKKINVLAIVCLVLVLFTGCEEEDFCAIPKVTLDQDQLATDLELIDDYINTNVLTASVHSSGFRYIINQTGNNKRPNNCSLIRISYQGRLLDNTEFDGTSPGNTVDFMLNQLISGWQRGLPLIGEGGSITLFLPSGYGYGAAQVGSIPPNSPLIFDVDLVRVYN